MSNWQNFFPRNDDEDEDDQTEFDQTFATKDGVIFLIDTNQTMFQKSDDDGSHFDLCVKCARSVMGNKIISSDKDLVGVVFFGTDKNKNKNDFRHIYVLQDLEQPSAGKILELESHLENNNNDFKAKYGHSSSFSLSDALWCCSNMFSQCSQKLGHKRILLFTNNDSPHADNIALQRQAKAKASDLNSNGIDIELLHLRLPGHNFDVSRFYQDIIFAPDDEELSVMPDASDKFDELLTRVRTKDHKKRSQGKLNFSLGSDFDLAVNVYTLTSKTSKPYSVNLYKRTNEEVRKKSTYFCEETGEQLMPSDIKKFQTFGGRKIAFEKDELKEMKKFGDPGLVLLGFKPKSYVKNHFHFKSSQFLFPDESRIKGSTTAFSALLQKCIDRDVVPICQYISRQNTPPRCVALVGQKEELDDQNMQVQPSGFHLIFLPYSDDMRKLNLQKMPKATPEQVDKAKEIIKKLQFKYNPSSFENPALQTFWRNLEVLALDKDMPEEFTDFTAPDVDRINSRAGKLINEFKEMVYPDGYTPGQKAAPKRKPVGDAGANKRCKTDETTEIDVGQMAKEGKLAKLTVADLRSFCQAKKLQTSGKKSELVERVKKFCGE
ncbi:X-ray repair cross-complementing protein 5-like [Anneissia japonica]|uniref:X-ray repair cross-complementing protein 5-like n=1 Tax=Anneissia japonica TaxID=1529436 RepID=UPI0014259E4D|nr:X-ray repair cross-complementing protein 5-like [Anneissia japonica]XP_033119385.1 X-ray repair cross-complementing protein 5-like [Anneissia japonica]